MEPSGLPGLFNGFQEHGVRAEGAVPDGTVHADIVLGNHPARAQVGVSGLGVSGLAGLQAHIVPAGTQPAVGVSSTHGIPGCRIRQEEGIIVVPGAVAPAVQNDEHTLGIRDARRFDEGTARHLGGLFDAQNGQHRGGHIPQTAVPEGECPVLGVHHQEGNLVGGVGHMGLALGIPEGFDVAVVGGNGHQIPVLQGVAGNLIHIAAHRGGGGQLGLGIGGVADDIAVGEVRQDEVIPLVHTGHDLLGHLGQAQLRLLVEGDALGGGNADVGLPGEGLIVTAVEEEGHMGVLLGLGAVELPQPRLADDLGQGLHHPLRGEGDGQVLELLVIHGHNHEAKIL